MGWIMSNNIAIYHILVFYRIEQIHSIEKFDKGVVVLIPKYLYHYSSVDKLKSIVNSRNIRFTRLDALNDPLEGLIDDKEDTVFKKLVYVSCWNDQEAESINLWHMYSNTDVIGVRIKMKNPIFGVIDYLNLVEYESCFVPSSKISSLKTKTTYDRNDVDVEINKIFGPIKVVYTERSKLSDYTRFGDEISLEEVGLRKASEWSFENEWRFKIILKKRVPEKLCELDTVEYIDIPFNINNICEILTSPNMEVGEIDGLKIFLKNEGVTASVLRSALRIRAKKY
jgi:hypothetical protein